MRMQALGEGEGGTPQQESHLPFLQHAVLGFHTFTTHSTEELGLEKASPIAGNRDLEPRYCRNGSILTVSRSGYHLQVSCCTSKSKRMEKQRTLVNHQPLSHFPL